MDDFERELQQSFERRPAPPSLKRRVLERRVLARRVMERRAGGRYPDLRMHMAAWQRLAASVVLAAAIGGALMWRHQAEQRRKGEEARQQVFTALRITSRALDQMNEQLTARARADQE